MESITEYLGVFHGYADNNAHGRYNCTFYCDGVTREGKNVIVHNPRVVMTKTDSNLYTTNRIAGFASIEDIVVKNNTTLNPYNTQSPNTITFSLGTTTIQTTKTTVGIWVEIASTGGSYDWGNFQSTKLAKGVTLECPPANPTYTTKPTITNIQETSVVVNRGETDISSIFYYKYEGVSDWTVLSNANTTLSSLSPNTDYNFEFKVVNAELPELETSGDKIAIKTYQYPYVSGVSNTEIEIGGDQTLTLYNPLSRSITVFMTHETQNGTVIYQGTTQSKTNYIFKIPEEAAGQAIGATKTEGNAKYYCKYNNIVVAEKDGVYKTSESAFKPVWDETKIDSLFKYKDGNDIIVNITENNQTLIQRYSQLYYGINYNTYPAIANGGSNIAKYQISINHQPFVDVSKSSTSADINSGFTIPENAINITIALKAIDSRGYQSNILTKVLKVDSYNIPYGSISIEREGGYGETVHLTINPVWGINKNNAGSAIYKYGINKNNLDKQGTVTTFDTPVILYDLDNESNFTFEVTLIDALGNSSIPIVGSLGIGEPILFIDVGDETTGVGVNCFPETKGFYVKGDAVFHNTATAKENLIVEQNLIVNGYLNAGSHRQQYMERNGKPRTGWFYIGGN